MHCFVKWLRGDNCITLSFVAQNYNDYDDDCGDFGDDDCGDEDGIVDDRVGFDETGPGVADTKGRISGYGDLIDEEPQIENISLAYETIAKRVDVRLVKQNLWKKVMPLHEEHDDDAQCEEEETQSTEETKDKVCVICIIIR